MHVDETRADHQPRGVDRFSGLLVASADGSHSAVAHQHVVDPVDALRGINHPATANEKCAHQWLRWVVG